MRSRIYPTFADNNLIIEYTVLVASISVGYEIDLACLIVEQIHKATLKSSPSIPVPCLIYYLYLESRVESLYLLDLLIEAECTLDGSLIKAEENMVAIQ